MYLGRTVSMLSSSALLLLAVTGSAQPFCRTTTDAASGTTCTCVTSGTPVAWPISNVEYVLNERGFPDLSENKVRATLAQAFGAWTSLTCPSLHGDPDARGPIPISVHAAEGTTAAGPGYDRTGSNENVIAHLGAQQWLADDHDPNAFALTLLAYDIETGAFLDVDMIFNGAHDPFVNCPAPGCPADGSNDLLNVATHEVGHFLGLAHSQATGSTMECTARTGDTQMRSLESGDIEGMCTIYPLDAEFAGEAPRGESDPGNDEDCAAGPARDQTPQAWLGLLCMIPAALVYRRRGGIAQ